jgi:hypothetical protein
MPRSTVSVVADIPKKGSDEPFFEDTKLKRAFLLETESYYYKEKRSRKK